MHVVLDAAGADLVLFPEADKSEQDIVDALEDQQTARWPRWRPDDGIGPFLRRAISRCTAKA